MINSLFYLLISLMILLRCTPENSNSTVDLIIKELVITLDKVNLYDMSKIIKVDTLTILDTTFVSPQKNVIEIKPENIRTDSVIQDFPLTNLIDDIPFLSEENKGTRFALPGYPHWLAFNFDKVVKIDSIEINTFLWNEDYNQTISIFSWGDSLTEFTTKSELYSGHSIQAITSHLIFRIDSGKNDWMDIGEIKFFSINNYRVKY